MLKTSSKKRRSSTINTAHANRTWQLSSHQFWRQMIYMNVTQRQTLNCCPFTDVKLLHLEAPSAQAEFLLFRVHLHTVWRTRAGTFTLAYKHNTHASWQAGWKTKSLPEFPWTNLTCTVNTTVLVDIQKTVTSHRHVASIRWFIDGVDIFDKKLLFSAKTLERLYQ